MMRRVLALVLATAATPAQAAVPEIAASAPGDVIEQALPRLRELLRAGILTREPSTNIWRRAERQSVFDGSYDWHSCVAAHWAALSSGRMSGDDELVLFVLDRLSPEVLRVERALWNDPDAGSQRVARTRRSFTPYADAWMLILLDEVLRHHRREDAELLAFRVETEDRLLGELERLPFPDGLPAPERGGKPFCGFYRSWLFGYLALCIAGPSGDGARARQAALGSGKFGPQRAALAAYADRHPFDFLHVSAVAELIERVDPAIADAGPARVPADFDPLPATVTLRTVHTVGVALSELWPIAAAGARDPVAREVFERRLAEFLGRTDLWADDFTVVSHWVPQFVWFGVWLSRGRP